MQVNLKNRLPVNQLNACILSHPPIPPAREFPNTVMLGQTTFYNYNAQGELSKEVSSTVFRTHYEDMNNTMLDGAYFAPATPAQSPARRTLPLQRYRLRVLTPLAREYSTPLKPLACQLARCRALCA